MAEWSRKKVNVYLEGSHCSIDSQQHMLKGAKRFTRFPLYGNYTTFFLHYRATL